MGLFDGLSGLVSDAINGRPINILAVAENVFRDAGGVNGILAQLQQSGLGDQVTSWIGTGHNLPVSADQIQSALSNEQLRSLAKAFGVDVDSLPQLLAQHLPTAVDRASPNGALPS